MGGHHLLLFYGELTMAIVIAIDGPSCVHLAYRPGVSLVHTVIRAGEEVAG